MKGLRNLKNQVSKTLLLITVVSGLLILPERQAWAGNSEDGSRKSQAKSEKYALLIGINDYSEIEKLGGSAEKVSLHGCINDVRDTKQLLVERFNFPDDTGHILTLTDKEATRSSILESFRHQLIDNARKNPEATFYFHFSGHGATGIPDESGEESDNFDECIVPADINPIIDDEIASLCNELGTIVSGRGSITLVFDCCHSGTLTRGMGVSYRELSLNDTVLQRAKQIQEGLKDLKATASGEDGFLPASDKYAALYACMSSQKEPETTDEPPHKNGVLTRYLINTLRESNRSLTNREIRERIDAKVASKYYISPQLDGNSERLFLSSMVGKGNSLPLRSVEGKEVSIDAGLIHGIKLDSIVGFYEPDPKDSIKEILVAQAVVTSVGTQTCVAILPLELAQKTLTNARLVLITPGFNASPIRVAIDMSVPAYSDKSKVLSFQSNLKKTLSSSPWVEVSEYPSENAARKAGNFDIILTHERATTLESNPLLERKKFPPEPLYIMTAKDTEPLFGFYASATEENAPELISEALRKYSRYSGLIGLVNSASDAISLSLEESKTQKSKDIEVRLKRSDSDKSSKTLARNEFKPRDRYFFEVRNNSKSDLFVYAIGLGSDGMICALKPKGGVEAISPGGTATFPTITAETAGTDYFRIIATRRKSGFEFLDQSAISRGEKQVGKDASNLGSFLRRTIERSRDDGGAVYPPMPDEWGTLLLGCEVKN